MSKFDYGTFVGGYDEFAVSKEKHTKEQAIELYCVEHSIPKGTKIAITNAFVRHRVGWNEDNERCCGWWLEYEEHSRSCPVYAFHEVLNEMPSNLESEYEWIDVKEGRIENQKKTMIGCPIEVITYEESRLAHFRDLRDKQKKKLEQFEKSNAFKAPPLEERHNQLSQMGEVFQYYDDIVKMLEQRI